MDDPAPVFDCVFCAKDQLMLSMVMNKNLADIYNASAFVTTMIKENTGI